MESTIIIPMLCRLTKMSTSFPFNPVLNHSLRYFSKTPASRHTDLTAHVDLFVKYGFLAPEIPDFLKKNDFLLSSSLPEVDKSFKILLSMKLPQDFLVSTVRHCPRILQHEFLEKWQLGITRLGISNTTSVAVKNVLEIARRFELNPCDVFRSVKCLKGFGFSDNTIVRVLEIVPTIIVSGEDKIYEKVMFLMDIGIQRREIDRIFSSFPEILSFGVRNRLKPLLDEFEGLGFSTSGIIKEVIREPKVLGFENGELTQCLELLKNLKCRPVIKENIVRNGEFRAGYEVKLRIDCLRKHGLIHRDAFIVLQREPRVILYGIVDIEKKIDYLVHNMKFQIQCLVEVPEYLGVNFDKHIVPRFNVIQYLRLRGGLGDEVSLRSLIKASRLKFYNMYVKPYPECEEIYGRFAGDAVQSRHPVGIWKLFTPQKYPKTNQDIKNIKSYVKSLS